MFDGLSVMFSFSHFFCGRECVRPCVDRVAVDGNGCRGTMTRMNDWAKATVRICPLWDFVQGAQCAHSQMLLVRR